MNRTEHLLSILAEECAEVAQRATKAMRFGLTEVQSGQALTNAQRIIVEYADMVAVMEMLLDEGSLDRGLKGCPPGFENLVIDKTAKVEKFLKYSKECGTLHEAPPGETL